MLTEENVLQSDDIPIMKRSLSKFKSFSLAQLDTSLTSFEQDDEEEDTPRASEPPTSPGTNPMEQKAPAFWEWREHKEKKTDKKRYKSKDDKKKTEKKRNKDMKDQKKRKEKKQMQRSSKLGGKENVANPPALRKETPPVARNDSSKETLQKRKTYGKGVRLLQVV